MSEIISSQQFVDRMAEHRSKVDAALETKLPKQLSQRIIEARANVRQALQLSDSDMVVIFGEQTYGLNERPKVLGKRIFAKDLEVRHGVQPVELFANYDVVGSEAGIYRMSIPSPQARDGVLAINTLPGWSKRKNTPTRSFQPTDEAELNRIANTLTSYYGDVKANSLVRFLGRRHQSAGNYADANIAVLRDLENQIGLNIPTVTTEEYLDSLIMQSGGAEIILDLWPQITNFTQQNPQDGVRPLSTSEAPFQLYHSDSECHGRMKTEFQLNGNCRPDMDTPIAAKCMECGAEESETVAHVCDSQRPVTLKAIPRVILYSTLGFDGHITGGGSIYNDQAEAAAHSCDLEYFPTVSMVKKNEDGTGRAVIVYDSHYSLKQSSAQQPYHQDAQALVQQGKTSTADVVLSVGTENLRQAIEGTLENEVTNHTQVICPPPIPRGHEVIGE